MRKLSNYGRFVTSLRFLTLATALLTPTISAQAAEMMNIRGARYCEVIYTESMTKYVVYNTFGLNDCPESLWRRITVEQVKKEANSSFAHLNGPRHWVIDGFKNSSMLNTHPKTFGGLAMRKAGVLNISILEGIRAKTRSNPHYQQWRVERKTTWVYESGKPVYELIDPEGHIFVMQSYSLQKQSQTESSLSSLGKTLTLPSGWRFKTGVLQKQEELPVKDNVAIVVQDNFLNTYQMAGHDFL